MSSRSGKPRLAGKHLVSAIAELARGGSLPAEAVRLGMLYLAMAKARGEAIAYVSWALMDGH